MSTPLPFLRINTPPVFKSPEEQIQYFAIELNRIFEQLTRWLQDNSEQSEKVRVFGADLDLTGHRILNQANPVALTDGANRRYVDEQDDVLQEQLTEIQDDIHNGGDSGGNRSLLLQRAVPTTVDDIIEIGSFHLTGDAYAADIAISVSANAFSVAKAYTLVSQRGINSAWEIMLPLVDTGAGSSQDFSLDVKQDDATSTLALRIRRTLGTTAGTATIQITPRHAQNATFTESLATASVAAPVLFLESALFTIQNGNLGVNTSTPNLAASGVAVSVSGDAGVDERGGVELLNTTPGTTSTLGHVRFYGGATFLVGITGRADGAVDSGAFSFFTKETTLAIALAMILTSTQNLVIGGGASTGSGGKKMLVLGTGTAPSSGLLDSVQLHSIDAAAGNACLGVTTENGDQIKIFKGAALTASDGTLGNVVTRVGQIEARLQALGLL